MLAIGAATAACAAASRPNLILIVTDDHGDVSTYERRDVLTPNEKRAMNVAFVEHLDDGIAPLELYNLKDDPREERNVIREQARIARELELALRAHIQRGGMTHWQKPTS